MKEHTFKRLIFIQLSLLLSLTIIPLNGQNISELETGCESLAHPIALSYPRIVKGLYSNCQCEVFADEINMGSYDNDLADDLSFEIAVLDADNNLTRRGKSIIFYCDDVGQTLLVFLVTDLDGNQSYAKTVFELQGGDCIDPNCAFLLAPLTTYAHNLFGNVLSGKDEPLNCVDLIIDGRTEGSVNQQYSILLSAQSGIAEATIEFDKEDKLDNGLNILDLILVRRYILRLGDFPFPFGKRAANVNDDSNINTLDMIQIRQAILRQIDEYTAVPTWRFYPIINIDWNELERQITYFNLSTSDLRYELNWYGIKMGDVNGDVNISRESSTELALTSTDAELISGQEFGLEIELPQNTELSGYQFTLAFNPVKLELIRVDRLAAGNANFDQIEQGKISIIGLANGDEALKMIKPIFRAKENCKVSEEVEINSKLIFAEAYDQDLSRFELKLEFITEERPENDLVLTPNPFTEKCNIQFYLDKADDLLLEVFNTSGVLVHTAEHHLNTNENSLTLKASSLEKEGMYFVRLTGSSFNSNFSILYNKFK